MAMQRMSILRMVQFLLLVILFFTIMPTEKIYASGNVFDCTNNPEECEEDSNSLTGDKKDEKGEVVGSNNPITVWEYLKTILALIFVIGLLFMLLKFINRKNRLFDKSRLMKNLGGISLGQQKSVQLITIGNSYYLIGVGEDIHLLKEITDEEEIATLLKYYEEIDETPTMGAIGQLIETIKSKKNVYESKTETNSNDFSNMFNSQLDEIKKERKKRLSEMTEKERNQDE